MNGLCRVGLVVMLAFALGTLPVAAEEGALPVCQAQAALCPI